MGVTRLSFRFRLRLFFIVIVLVPMLAVALVLFSVVAGSEEGKSDARLGQAQRAASGLFQALQRRAQASAEQIGADPGLAAAVQARDRDRIEAALERLRTQEGLAFVLLRLDGDGRFAVGRADAVAPARSRLLGPQGGQVGELVAAGASAPGFAAEVRRLTGMEVGIDQGERTVATTLAEPYDDLPLRGDASLGAREFRVAGFTAPAVEGDDISVHVLADQRDAQSNVSDSTIAVAAVLAAFLVLAFAFALMVSRSLQARIAQLLGAARRLGRGDFEVEVPTEGSDEFAQLGTEFNEMARQLQSRLHELQREQERLQLAVRRVGDSFARGLDREALLDIAVETAVDGVGARCGRATVREGARDLRQVAVQGDADGFGRAMRAAEIAALDASRGVETQVGDTSVLSEPLLAEEGDEILGLITVARSGEPFTPTERDLFRYLAAQAAISVENADLHQVVRRQAVTDELTNLFNHRHFQEVLNAEVERARRYGQDLGLIMLDIDDFKSVNDTHGHLQGDLVLREVGRVLRESARDVDEPARYGGEELAVVLPQTDLEGAFRFGERVRQRIEHLQMPRLDGKGTVQVTASIGAASLRGDDLTSKDALVAAADAALYRAKRRGKNCTARGEVERDGRAY